VLGPQNWLFRFQVAIEYLSCMTYTFTRSWTNRIMQLISSSSETGHAKINIIKVFHKH